MFIKKGKNRLVIVFPGAGIAIKFPLIHGIRALRSFFSYGFKRPYAGKVENEVNKSLGELLFKGMGDNWREFRFYRETRHKFCQPTYFSLFGLFNIQRASQPCECSMQDLWSEVQAITTGAVLVDSHHFSNPHNFCHADGNFLILDYGHPKTIELIKQFGDKLCNCKHGVCTLPM